MIDNPKQPETSPENFDSNLSEDTQPSEQQDILLQDSQVIVEGEANQSSPNVQAGETIPEASASARVVEPIEESQSALQEELAVLKQQLQEQKQQTEAFKAQYIRNAADFDNFRKRTAKEKEALEQQIKLKTIGELLSVVDNFERARIQIKPADDGEMAIHKSYQGVYKNFVDSLKRLGVSPMRPEEQPFDPNYHEAMLREPTDKYPEDTVMEQLERGYMLGEQVLRHAKVKVAAAPAPGMMSQEMPPENSQATES